MQHPAAATVGNEVAQLEAQEGGLGRVVPLITN